MPATTSSSSKAPRPSREETLVAHVLSALRAAGWAPPRRPHPGALEVERGRSRYALEVRRAREPRRELVQALLADAVLRGRARNGEAPFVAIVGAPQVSPVMAEAVEAYAKEVVPGQPFGYVDDRGLVRLFGPGLDGVSQDPPTRDRHAALRAQPRDLFSDRNQWLLKVMLGPLLPEGTITLPARAPHSVGDMAELAGVSAPATWRLLAMLRAEGYMTSGPEPEMVRLPDLLARWRTSLLRGQREVGAIWARGGRDHVGQLRSALGALELEAGRPRACLGLHLAAEALGAGSAGDAPVYLYVRRLDLALLEGLGLRLAGDEEPADVVVRVARWPETVFRGALRRGRAWVTDVMQCWLDLGGEEVGGGELADALWRQALGPAFEDVPSAS